CIGSHPRAMGSARAYTFGSPRRGPNVTTLQWSGTCLTSRRSGHRPSMVPRSGGIPPMTDYGRETEVVETHTTNPYTPIDSRQVSQRIVEPAAPGPVTLASR